MHWSTSTVLAVTALVGVTGHAMTGTGTVWPGTWVPASTCP